ncbi:UNVERIFIED_CONTAM: hypothetical protein Sradi_1159400 [Sesamum radiatum]|uniref:Uncharacterized protein n=1 Tax=Sesamum radiatum TaxID=300843 RepID=A0AAW2UJG8_SESRA
MALLSNGLSILTIPPPSRPSNRRHLHFTTSIFRSRPFSGNAKLLFKSSNSRIESFPQDGVQSSDNVKPEIIPEDQNTVSDIAIGSLENKTADSGSPFLSKLGIFLGIAAVITLVSVGIKPPSEGTSLGIQFLLDGTSSSTLAAPTGAFSFRAFGYRVVLPEYAPGWIYFWLLMAAGCGLFISEEALNIWVGISLARLLSLDGTWQSLVDSFSRNAPYMISTVVWVYWGVCISDMIPFYLGKIFKQSGASNDIWSKLGVGKEKAMDITRTVQRYGNLIGFGHITRVFLCWGVLWGTSHSPITGNLDSVSICCGCPDSSIPLFATPLLQLSLLIFAQYTNSWITQYAIKPYL